MTWQAERPGGLNRYLADLHGALRQVGVRSQVVVVGAERDGADGVHAVGGPLPVRLVGLAVTARRLTRRADLLHGHFALHALLPVLTRPRGMPVVTSFQGPWADESRVEGDTSALRYHLRRYMEGAVYRRSAALVCLSQAFADILVRNYGVPPWRTRVLSPGVDLDHFRPRKQQECRRRLGLPEQGPVVLAVRRLAERMGLEVLLAAWAGRPDGLLLLAGDGPVRDTLVARAAALGLADDRVRFLGRVSESDLPLLYAAADVSVVPSTQLEGYGLVVLESLAAGTPVVASDVGGLAEVLPQLQPDLVVPAGDVAALKVRLERALDGRQPLPDRQACRRFAEQFDWLTVGRRFEQLYAEVTRRRPPGPQRFRVVYLLSTAQPSGGELALLRTIMAVQNRVHAHVVLAEDGPMAELLRQAGISCEVLALGRVRQVRRAAGSSPVSAVRHGGQLLAHSLRLARRLRRLQPDLVHANSLKAGLYGGPAARLAGMPLVWHVRDRLADDYLPPLAVRVLRRAVRHLPHGVVANSTVTAATLSRRQDQPVAVIPSPVYRPEGFARERVTGPLRFVSVGRLTPWKGQHVLVRAFTDAFGPGEATLQFVGGALFGEQDYAGGLQELVAALGRRADIDFLGHRPDIWPLLARADVLVHCAVLPEPHGNVVVEGLAAGLAVIASDAGGPRALIRHGETGLLVPPGDVPALTGALRTLADDPALRERLGQAAEGSVHACHPDVVAAAVTRFYRQVAPAAPAATSAG